MNLIQDFYTVDEAIEAINGIFEPIPKYNLRQFIQDYSELKIRLSWEPDGLFYEQQMIEKMIYCPPLKVKLALLKTENQSSGTCEKDIFLNFGWSQLEVIDILRGNKTSFTESLIGTSGHNRKGDCHAHYTCIWASIFLTKEEESIVKEWSEENDITVDIMQEDAAKMFFNAPDNQLALIKPHALRQIEKEITFKDIVVTRYHLQEFLLSKLQAPKFPIRGQEQSETDKTKQTHALLEVTEEEPTPILYKPETQKKWVRWIINNKGLDDFGNVKPRFRAKFLTKGRNGFSEGQLAKIYDSVVKEFKS